MQKLTSVKLRRELTFISFILSQKGNIVCFVSVHEIHLASNSPPDLLLGKCYKCIYFQSFNKTANISFLKIIYIIITRDETWMTWLFTILFKSNSTFKLICSNKSSFRATFVHNLKSKSTIWVHNMFRKR